jgi:KTSC domain
MTEPDMQMVDSSNVEAVGYDSAAREIYIRFLGGRTYAYGEADEHTFEELRSADSVGSYLNRVLKPNHPYREI